MKPEATDEKILEAAELWLESLVGVEEAEAQYETARVALQGKRQWAEDQQTKLVDRVGIKSHGAGTMFVVTLQEKAIVLTSQPSLMARVKLDIVDLVSADAVEDA